MGLMVIYAIAFISLLWCGGHLWNYECSVVVQTIDVSRALSSGSGPAACLLSGISVLALIPAGFGGVIYLGVRLARAR
jgi:hypothetical protein